MYILSKEETEKNVRFFKKKKVFLIYEQEDVNLEWMNGEFILKS